MFNTFTITSTSCFQTSYKGYKGLLLSVPDTILDPVTDKYTGYRL